MIPLVNTDHIEGLFEMPVGLLPEMVAGARVAFVTDAFLVGLSAFEPVVSSLPEAELIVTPVGEPTVATVSEIARRLAVSNSQKIVAFGGGSVIDAAKLASVAAATGTEVEWHLGTARTVAASLDVVAVPTTSGSGAEVTRTSVVSVDGRKSWAWNDHLRPEAVLVDSTLTHELPGSATIATGLDALVHALEAATAPDAEPAAVASGMVAVDAILEALPAAVADGADPAARAAMLDAALCAGFAIDLAGTGVGHGVGHALASMTTIPHGLAVAFGMWSCLEWGMEGAAERYARVGDSVDLYRRIHALIKVIGFEEEMRRWTTGPIESEALATELAQPEHRPMCLNNARPVSGDDVDLVARMVSRSWNSMLR